MLAPPPDRGSILGRRHRHLPLGGQPLASSAASSGWCSVLGAVRLADRRGELRVPCASTRSQGRDQETVRDRLAALGLDGMQAMYPGSLSGGPAQAVGLARALVLSPEILIFDRPTTGLDPGPPQRRRRSWA
ncbi:MAG: ATP-binding cassette domain-containing protein [Tessaracoccus sp.]|uniref:ATP-binding cassette domain-containing protein n=1 Tax=Tessaracoccus sp. TaxID=1971211 RepID=UPI001EC35C37|nr:ATP-binding cassette domain-containing protein [Tessaracoccus sp.]MBK7823540.1 ATP-binding cassette domain-containing protein [Tessaracoccus sp.]